MSTVYKGLQSLFVSLAWPWSGRSSPLEEPVGVLGPWTGAQCGLAPVLLPATIWPTQSLTGWHFFTWLVGWPIAAGYLAGWLTDYLTKCQPDPPPDRHLVAKCVTTVVRLTCGQMYPDGQRHLVAKCDTTSGQVDLFIWG